MSWISRATRAPRLSRAATGIASPNCCFQSSSTSLPSFSQQSQGGRRGLARRTGSCTRQNGRYDWHYGPNTTNDPTSSASSACRSVLHDRRDHGTPGPFPGEGAGIDRPRPPRHAAAMLGSARHSCGLCRQIPAAEAGADWAHGNVITANRPLPCLVLPSLTDVGRGRALKAG